MHLNLGGSILKKIVTSNAMHLKPFNAWRLSAQFE
jgi:hypothetical protein